MAGPLKQQYWYECNQCYYINQNPFNLAYHLKCHTRNQRIKCPLCSFSSNVKFYTDRHLELHHINFKPTPLDDEEMEIANIIKPELVDLCDDDDEPAEENSLVSFHMTSEAAELNLKKTKIDEIEGQKIELEEAECRRRISQCKEYIKMARICMEEMRDKVKKQKEIRSDKESQKEILSHCLELIRSNAQKLSNLSIGAKALDTFRSNIRDSNRKKLQSELQLRALQLKDLETKKHLNESVDQVVVFESNDGAIESLKNCINGMKNELDILREKETILARDVELMNQSLLVVVEVPEQVVQGLQSEMEELESGIKASLQSETEDVFNQLIISAEGKISCLFELKNSLLEIMFMKKKHSKKGMI